MLESITTKSSFEIIKIYSEIEAVSMVSILGRKNGISASYFLKLLCLMWTQ